MIDTVLNTQSPIGMLQHFVSGTFVLLKHYSFRMGFKIGSQSDTEDFKRFVLKGRYYNKLKINLADTREKIFMSVIFFT